MKLLRERSENYIERNGNNDLPDEKKEKETQSNMLTSSWAYYRPHILVNQATT